MKTGEGEQQGENEVQGAGRGRRRKDRQRKESVVKAENQEQLPGRQGHIAAGHSLSSEVTSCVGPTP